MHFLHAPGRFLKAGLQRGVITADGRGSSSGVLPDLMREGETWGLPGFSLNGFNPRPPITAGESNRLDYQDLSWFQSAPANYGGRICGISLADSMRCFNPRPPITAGESTVCRDDSGLRGMMFQSAPANYGGRIGGIRYGITTAGHLRVSIRARQLRRANLACAIATTASVFQSAPANYGGRIPSADIVLASS